MLSKIESARVVRDFGVYDLEWVPGTLELRLAGYYDGNRYEAFTSIEQLLDHTLTSANRGKWFYAHAGGLYDVQWVLEHLIDRIKSTGQYHVHYEVNCSFSGSSAIIVKVTRGKNCWYSIDSYWLLRDKLSNIGKYIGLHKGMASLEPTADPEED